MLKSIQLDELPMYVEKKYYPNLEVIPYKYLNKTFAYNCNDVEVEKDSRIVFEILETNMSLQYAASIFYRSLKNAKSEGGMQLVYDGQQHIMGIVPDKSIQTQLEQARRLFLSVSILYDGDEERELGIRVSAPSVELMITFEEMLKSNLVNKWISYSITGDDIQDTLIEAYEVIPDEEDIVSVDVQQLAMEMKEDGFFKYLLSKNDCIENRCLRIPGSLEDVQKDINIKALSQLVSRLFVFTMVDRDKETGEKRYSKYLSWFL